MDPLPTAALSLWKASSQSVVVWKRHICPCPHVSAFEEFVPCWLGMLAVLFRRVGLVSYYILCISLLWESSTTAFVD